MRRVGAKLSGLLILTVLLPAVIAITGPSSPAYATVGWQTPINIDGGGGAPATSGSMACGGAYGVNEGGPGGPPCGGITCGTISPIQCIAWSNSTGTGYPEAQYWNGTTWSSMTIGSGSLGSWNSISCTGGLWCIAVNENDNSYTYSGGTWTYSGTVVSPSVSCFAVQYCWAIDTGTDDVIEYTPAGWGTPVQAFNPLHYGNTISCRVAGNDYCYAADTGSDYSTWSSGTGSWSLNQSLPIAGSLSQLSCTATPNAADDGCVGVFTNSSDVYFAASDTWASIGSGNETLTSVDCHDYTTCWIADDHGNVYTGTVGSGGWTWQTDNIDGITPPPQQVGVGVAA